MPPTRKKGVRPSEVFASRVRQIREGRGWSQGRLADALAGIGDEKDRTTIAKIEAGSRGVTVDDVFAIAAALEVSPLHLCVPRFDGEPVAVAPSFIADSFGVREWVAGHEPLKGQDAEVFWRQLPEGDVRRVARTLPGFLVLALALQDVAMSWAHEDLDAMDDGVRTLEREVGRMRDEIELRRRRKSREQRRGTRS